MRLVYPLLSLLFFINSVVAFPGADRAKDKVVYQVDDRKDVCESTNELFKAISINAIAAMVDSSVLMSPVDGTYNHLKNYRPLGTKRNLCSGQKFTTHPTAAICSATLIAPDRMLTAGHCITDATCGRRKFVFNYMYTGNDCTMPSITTDDVYSCARVKRVENDQVDYAVVWLDRAVVGRVPVEVRETETPVTIQQALTVIGFGSGIPAKIDGGGYVIDPRVGKMDYFVASTDTFAGNSGSGVFNSDGVLIGILVRGQVDYVRVGSCFQVNVVGCTDEKCSKLQDAEEITYVHRAIQAAPNCRVSSGCPSSSMCSRRCEPESDSCTGWCVST
eukprot:c25831_g1_i1.p1 GENE.c25831_g1_i1~~c25831_g1_i1.p1  ORF type:complete len:332 (-),score=47.70 c25831_g1_i1:157-1152(-)